MEFTSLISQPYWNHPRCKIGSVLYVTVFIGGAIDNFVLYIKATIGVKGNELYQ